MSGWLSRSPVRFLALFFLQLFIPFDAVVTVAQVLKVFEEATRWLCADNYPTLNKAVRVYNGLIDELEYFLGQANDEEKGRQRAAIVDRCSPAAKRALKAAMKEARVRLFEYYSKTGAGMYAVALILDPTFKLEYYEENEWTASEIAGAKNALLQVIEEYGGTPEAATVPQPSQASSIVDSIDDPYEWLAKRKRKRRRVEKESELERYLKADTIEAHADILKWWKQNAEAYPCLARIARNYLAIPATSAPAERVFSGGADLVPDKRGSMDKETIRMCMCLDSWLRLFSR
jgi:hypothetical protein